VGLGCVSICSRHPAEKCIIVLSFVTASTCQAHLQISMCFVTFSLEDVSFVTFSYPVRATPANPHRNGALDSAKS
jgi:hypothetical protein